MLPRAIAGLLSCLSLTSISAHASPWIFPGDARTRHHIQFLVDSGVMNLPTTTWPLAWSSVKASLDNTSTNNLSDAQIWSLNYLQHELQKAMNMAYTDARSEISSDKKVLKGFESQARDEKEAEVGITLTLDQFAMRLNGVFAHEPYDEETGRIDGSYLSLLVGNWSLGAGAIDHWWGPGWNTSTILSHNARPAPGLFLKRNSTSAIDLPVISLLGEWQFVTFLNQLQDSYGSIDDPLMWGARFSFTPLQGLEIGLSRTALWAGDEQPNGAKALQNVILGKEDGEGSNTNNQLGGFDVRYGFNVGTTNFALYGQVTGEQGNTFQVESNIAMGGLELSTMLFKSHHRLTLEASNSTTDFYKDNPAPNFAYEHDNYRQGYRYLGRPMGASSDNDSEMISLAGQHYFPNGQSLNWRLVRANLNKDGTNTPYPGGSVFGDGRTKVDNLQLSYTIPATDRLFVEIGGSHLADDIFVHGENVESSASLALYHHW